MADDNKITLESLSEDVTALQKENKKLATKVAALEKLTEAATESAQPKKKEVTKPKPIETTLNGKKVISIGPRAVVKGDKIILQDLSAAEQKKFASENPSLFRAAE